MNEPLEGSALAGTENLLFILKVVQLQHRPFLSLEIQNLSPSNFNSTEAKSKKQKRSFLFSNFFFTFRTVTDFRVVSTHYTLSRVVLFGKWNSIRGRAVRYSYAFECTESSSLLHYWFEGAEKQQVRL